MPLQDAAAAIPARSERKLDPWPKQEAPWNEQAAIRGSKARREVYRGDVGAVREDVEAGIGAVDPMIGNSQDKQVIADMIERNEQPRVRPIRPEAAMDRVRPRPARSREFVHHAAIL